MRRTIPILLIVFALAPRTSAHPLLDRVPADAFFYLGWRGTDSVGPTYDNSHLAAIVKASNIADVVNQTIPQLFAKLGNGAPEAQAMQQAAIPLLKHAWKRPTVVYIAPRLDPRGR